MPKDKISVKHGTFQLVCMGVTKTFITSDQHKDTSGWISVSSGCHLFKDHSVKLVGNLTLKAPPIVCSRQFQILRPFQK